MRQGDPGSQHQGGLIRGHSRRSITVRSANGGTGRYWHTRALRLTPSKVCLLRYCGRAQGWCRTAGFDPKRTPAMSVLNSYVFSRAAPYRVSEPYRFSPRVPRRKPSPINIQSHRKKRYRSKRAMETGRRQDTRTERLVDLRQCAKKVSWFYLVLTARLQRTYNDN